MLSSLTFWAGLVVHLLLVVVPIPTAVLVVPTRKVIRKLLKTFQPQILCLHKSLQGCKGFGLVCYAGHLQSMRAKFVWDPALAGVNGHELPPLLPSFPPLGLLCR